MAQAKTFKQRVAEFKPSKTLWFWSCAGCVVLTMIIGFAFGGWVTGGTAKEMAQTAADDARAQLVASACVEKFTSSADFAAKLAKLKGTNSWARSDMLEDGGWVTLAGMKEPLNDAAEICSDKLAAMETPVTSKTTQTEATATQ
jgi:hypothetical protein